MRSVAKALTAGLVLIALLAGCQSTSNGGSPSGSPSHNPEYSSDDGASRFSAVVLRTHSESEADSLISNWVSANYPGYRPTTQELVRDDLQKKVFKVVTILGPGNDTKPIYFDFTQAYRDVNEPLPNPRTRPY